MQIRREFKTNNQKPHHSKTPLWWAKNHYGGPLWWAKTTSASPISQSLSGKHYPKKKIGATEKQDPAHNPPQQNFTTIKPLGASTIFKFLAQVDVRRNISPDKIFYDKDLKSCFSILFYVNSVRIFGLFRSRSVSFTLYKVSLYIFCKDLPI